MKRTMRMMKERRSVNPTSNLNLADNKVHQRREAFEEVSSGDEKFIDM